jgi:hypothetical protein
MGTNNFCGCERESKIRILRERDRKNALGAAETKKERNVKRNSNTAPKLRFVVY